MKISDITTADADYPARVGIHSVEGWGKTTLAAEFPDAVFMAPENGFPRDLRRRPKRLPNITSWPLAFDALTMLRTEEHDYGTLVVDTIDWLEPLIHAFVCERDSGRQTEMNKGGRKLVSIEDYGYGKGYIAAEEEFRKWISAIDDLQYVRRMHVVLLMHSKVKKFENPGGMNFDRYEPKMHDRISAICKEWVETLLFGHYEIAVSKLEDEKRAKGVSTGKRLVGTRNNAAWDAKNRLGLPEIVEVGDPAVLVPYLLGQYVDAAAFDEPPPPAEKPAASSAKKSAAKGAPKDAAPAREIAGPDKTDGKPAHHPDRAEDEKARRDDALERARSKPAEKPAPEKPSKATTGRAAAKDPAPMPPDRAKKLIEELTVLLVDAKRVMGQAYADKVGRWMNLAKMDDGKTPDPDKLDAIVADVRQTLANNTKAA